MKRSVQHAFSLSGIQIPFGADTIENTQSIQSLSQTDYCGNFIYEDAQLSRILTPEGYIETTDSTGSTANTGNWRFSYFLKDHLGNVRARIACPDFSSPIPSSAPSSPPSSPAYTLLDTTDYYPFGMEISSPEGLLTSGNNPYLYNGKELDRMHGLNMYDYGARFYDATLGRWHVLDPSAEYNIRWTPYNYSFNNPIRFVDPDGNLPEDVTNKANSYKGTWYEFGGKNPYYIGGGGVNKAQAYFTSAIIYAGYEKTGFSYSFYKKNYVYYFNLIDVPEGYSMGIDCSGLSRVAFNADPDKQMSTLPHGAHNQMNAFSDAEKNGTGLLHTDFKQLKEGDLVFNTVKRTNKEGEKYDHAYHVMVATGKVDKNKDGKVTAYEVVHAPSKGEPVKSEMINVKDYQRIGHTNRDGDLIMNTYVSKDNGGMSWNDFYNWVSSNNLWDKLK